MISIKRLLMSQKVRPFLLPGSVGLVAAIAGVFLVSVSRAGSPIVMSELESGTVSGPAKVVNSVNSASESGVVVFKK